jgi:hypothetical protein
MATRRLSAGFLSLGAVALAAAASVKETSPPPYTGVQLRTVAGGSGVRGTLKRRLERLRQAVPGDGGQLLEGPGSADEEAFLNRAYPDSDIPLDRILRAKASFAAVTARGVARVGAPSPWVSLGPKVAMYQPTPFRNTYVPAQYPASGRVTAMAIGQTCTTADCKLWIAAAGGGVWRTEKALALSPVWQFMTGSIGINAAGSIVVDPHDATGNTLWLGTGEANASGDSAAGVGLYKSTDGGVTWTGPLGSDEFNGRSIGTIAVDPSDPNVLYVGTTRGVRGVSAVGGGVSLIPGAAKWGLYKSSDGGATFTFVHNGDETTEFCTGDATEANGGTPCSPRGVRRVAVDPSDSNTLYAGSYARGVWRSTDAGANWAQILAPLTTGSGFTDRPEIAVTLLPNGKTRMYVGEGASGSPYSRLFRCDDAAAGVPVFTDLTSSNPADAGFGSYNYCTGQCWYDNLVYTPPGHPDIVYMGGAYQYGEDLAISNGRALILSTDAGVTFTDMTKDSTHVSQPNGLHPDQHAVAVDPANPFRFFNGSDGGVMRSSGSFVDISTQCDSRGLSGPALARCKQLLSRVPTRLSGINRGLVTLQFQSLSVSPHDSSALQGGTQDNGTFQFLNTDIWPQTMWGDGGQSGYDVGIPAFRFHTFFNASPDVNFSNGAIADWNWIGDPIYGVEPQAFYIPMIADPVVSKSLYAGLSHVWRTKTAGLGTLSIEEFRLRCNEFTGDFTIVCGDWEPLATTYTPPAPPPQATRLTETFYGSDRVGGNVSAVERSTADTATLWAATTTGRVFISQNGDADPASAVVFTRLDPLSAADPNRFVSGIYVDNQNPTRAWISYNGYSATTPNEPGHVFEVTYDPVAGTATWVSLDGSGPGALGDLPVTDVVRDDPTGDLFVSTDFGVLHQASGSGVWLPAATGMPLGEVASLTIVPSARKLYAATHGLGAWVTTLQ